MDQRSKIAILGLGVEGKSMLEYLIKHEYRDITVCDRNVDIKKELPHGVSSQLGEDVYLNNLDEFDTVIRSPGVKYLDPRIQDMKAMGKEVTSPTAFFLDQCPCPVIGVSGTKGKGTTSTLIYMMLKEGGLKAYLGGNIGEPPVKFLDKLKKDNIVVLEMSSFQLQDLEKSPHYSVLLNTTVDHLDYHVDTEEYMEAKESLLSHQEKDSVVVLNVDYEYVKYYTPLTKGHVKFISRKRKLDEGAYEQKGVIYYCKKKKCEEIMRTSDVGLIGSHNLENVMPSIIIAKEFGVSNEDIVKVAKKFKGLPHRLEFVKEFHGVKFYNDSFSTNPLTSMAAVDSFDVPTTLIAGGYDKGLSYDEWAVKILTKENLHTVILIGDLAEKMEKELIAAEKKLGDAEAFPTKILRRNSLEEAILTAYMDSRENSVVVMSPAAASFDMFHDYKERGEKFREFVGKIR